MGTDKRARQKANRASRMAEAEEAARKQRTRSRLIGYGSLVVLAALAVGAIALLANDDDDTPSASDLSQTELADSIEDLTDDLPADDPAVSGVNDDPVEPAAREFVYGDGECPPEDGVDDPVIDFDGPQPQCIDPDESYVAVFDTSEGEVRVNLDTTNTPGTANNFATLARWGYYDETLLFRTDPSIAIIQGGSPHTQSASDPGPGYTITDEGAFATDPATGQYSGPYRYQPGQLVMARSAGPDAAGAQFFFTTGPETALLDGQGTYVVFGTADDAGLGILQSIIGLHVDDPSSGLGGGPSREVMINSVTIEQV